MKINFQGSQKKPIRVTISQKGLGKKFQKIHLFVYQYPKVIGVVTLFTVANLRPISTSSPHVGRRQYDSKLHLSTFDRNVPFIRIPLMPTSPPSSYPFQHCRQEEGMTMVFCSSPTPLSILSLITINIINMGQSEFLTHTRPSLVLCCIRA